ncbi:MAG: 3-isopropylmalate dehydratase large subunit [Xanthomonadales bacterium]|uniref:3-isopropylmalate dehydratase large subunit n=1 Tax=Dokdonella sp. TaxID=2291710 RepID=UPI002C406454|nr:3-isopropylmalate dehydratase large subunit [Xanthomonadales bacterium]HQV71977.1 3-isopropylmalate dehydratase large subunit [Dokdonella sp.]MBK7011342.1 3-isopropylmalate dehydratase large subunit [Xanthomonadales bacterium]MBK7211161.1 3-isopropylmalate dehydratase large subunit [Xanthomonadales bacterium]MBL0221660.1 3-isopropylmalate dehydratase large subunit [Xanthomonadales bacterium]
MKPRTIIEKIWDAHQVRAETSDTPGILYVDLHLIHEVTTPQAFSELRSRGLNVRCPGRVLATLDHSTPTLPADADGNRAYVTAEARQQVELLEANCREFGIELHGWNSEHRGIVHVIGPELGATQPGMTIVCGDSHTATHGAFGALAFGIGTTEVGHVLATQCLLQRKPKSMAIHVDGALRAGVSAKDLILHIIGRIGVGGGTGHVIEYRGAAIQALSMEERMTVCNMSIEAGARAGLIAPDQVTFDWLQGRPRAPQGAEWDRAVAAWRTLASDAGARHDSEVHIDASAIGPTISYGTHPGMVTPIASAIPAARDAQEAKALSYMHFVGGTALTGQKVDVVFVGSCTNSRLSDLREAAAIMRGRKLADGLRALIVPGSVRIKREAEAEGLDEVFRAAGAEWREAGCSMCIGMNGDIARPGQLVVSTSNRNFEGRQGPGVRTVLASPRVAAIAAIAGIISDPDAFQECAA